MSLNDNTENQLENGETQEVNENIAQKQNACSCSIYFCGDSIILWCLVCFL